MTDLELLQKRLPAHLSRYARAILGAAISFDLDQYVLAAIMDRESIGGDALIPKGPGGLGDRGFGHGLFQIDSHKHKSFLAARLPSGGHVPGPFLWAVPAFNATYAAWILYSNLMRAQGNLLIAIAGFNCDLDHAIEVAKRVDVSVGPNAMRAALDALTAPGPSGKPDYVSDILARRSRFLGVSA